MVDITENFVAECMLKAQTFFESICGKMFSWKGSLTVWALSAYFSDSRIAAFGRLVWCM